MLLSPEQSRHSCSYEDLRILDGESINSATHLIIPTIVGYKPMLERLFKGYHDLACANPPTWMTLCGHDLETRAFELLAEDCPELCVWRGGDFEIEGRDYTFELTEAMGWLFGTFGGDRAKPVLIGVPLREIIERYKEEKVLLGKGNLGLESIRIIPYIESFDWDTSFNRHLFRPPYFSNIKERSSWLWALIAKFDNSQGNTHLDYLYQMMESRLSKIEK